MIPHLQRAVMSKRVGKEKNIRTRLSAGKQSPYQTYKSLVVGEVSVGRFLIYELVTFFMGPMPGALGYFMRKQFYPLIVKQIGKSVIIGRNVTIRHPHRVILGDNVVIDDNCVIDARGGGKAGIVIEKNALINRNCMLLAKNGPIRIAAHASIGSNSVLVSMDGIEIGPSVLTAGGCYLSAGAYRFDDPHKPIMDQETYTKGPIRIDRGAWLGTRVTLLDGVHIGENAVIGALALVTQNVPEHTIVAGVPAKEITPKRSREV